MNKQETKRKYFYNIIFLRTIQIIQDNNITNNNLNCFFKILKVCLTTPHGLYLINIKINNLKRIKITKNKN